jgi:hypothetical protein
LLAFLFCRLHHIWRLIISWELWSITFTFSACLVLYKGNDLASCKLDGITFLVILGTYR